MFSNTSRPSAVDVLRPFAVGDIFTADTTTTLAKVTDVAVGNVLLSGGVGVIPAWGKVTLSSHVTGVLPAINGGTGIANAGTLTNATNTTITGGGTLALAGFTLTVPATGTAALLGVSNTFTADQAISTGALAQLSITSSVGSYAALNLTRGTSEVRIVNESGGLFRIYDAGNVWYPFSYTAGAVGAGYLTYAGTLDASSSTVAANVMSGGLAVAKSVRIGTTLAVTGAVSLTVPLASTSGGTGVNNAGTLTNATATTITGGGTLALGGFTLTAPATGTAALRGVANTFAALQEFSVGISLSAGNLLFAGGQTLYATTGDIYFRAGTGGQLRLGAGGNNDYVLLSDVGVASFTNTTAANAGATTGAIVASAGGISALGAVQSQLGFGVGVLPNASTPANLLATVAGTYVTRVRNNSSATTAFAGHEATNDGGVLTQFLTLSSGFTTNGVLVANAGGLYSSTAAGMFLSTAGGPITFAAAGTAEDMRLSAAGNLLVGTAADTGITGAGGISSANTTDATAIGTAAVVNAGGASFAKNLITGQGRGCGITSTATAAGTTTLTSASDEIQKFTGSTTQTIQFPAANLFGAGVAVRYVIDNHSSGTVTPTRAGADTFKGGGTTDPVLGGASTVYVSDGVSVWGRE